MVEWFIAPVLKTGDPQGSVVSNPTPSAMLKFNDLNISVALYRNVNRNISAVFHSFPPKSEHERLRTDRIDLFYQHRVDPNVPIEEVAGAAKGFRSTM